MKNLLILLVLFSQSAFGAAVSVRTNFSTSNLGTAYNTSSPQQAVCGLSKGMQHVFLYNGASVELAFNVVQGTKSTPPSSNIRDIYLPAGTGTILDGTGIGACIYQRSNSGSSVTTGYSIIYPY